ncbi:hypothetical protein ACTWP4_06840 [Gracilibacillus sp. D59]|uniref:hypothetical protein n=1 Tax=Gracilibacillus sp. D59 TaxID=3457434 RepID=UPI003FCD4027
MIKKGVRYSLIILLIGIATVLPRYNYGHIQAKEAWKIESNKLDNKFTVKSGPQMGEKVKVYDGTIEKYNGYYYLMGTGSRGHVYRSKDMIHWESAYELISDDPSTLPPYADGVYPRYGASDLFFHNGVMFYGFNGNNLVHGDPSTINNTPDFRHSFWEQKFDLGIDLQFFVAHDGELLYLRKVNPFEPDPNTGAAKSFDAGAWMWKVKSFFNEKGSEGRSPAQELIHTQKGHWASFDKFNFEGQEMYYDNGQYYLLYMGNNMAPRTGLYETGVAQSDHYDTFDNSSKYPGKLIARNLEEMILKYDVILPTAEHGYQTYDYTFTEPDGNWQHANYEPTDDWKSGQGGFGFPLKERNVLIRSIYNDGEENQSNIWGSPNGPDNIWVRREFQLDSVPETTALRLRVEGYGKVYVNGQEVHQQQGQQRSYQMIEVPSEFLHEGDNVVAAEVSTIGPEIMYYHVDFGLYDTNGKPVEADIVGPTQPNVIKGPNGFETWVTYKALWDGDNGQGKDRVYFWGDEMVVDGPTSTHSPDKHFDAWQPTFQDRFDSESSRSAYTNHEGIIMKDQTLEIQTPNGVNEILLKHYEIENYFLETNIKFDESNFGNKAQAGVTVWYQDEENYVRLFIDRDDRRYIIVYAINGEVTVEKNSLPDTFEFLHSDERASDFGEQYHTLKVYKNGSKLFAELDHYKLNNDEPVLELVEMSTPGMVGFVGEEANYRMDNVSLTIGWGEYGKYFNDWDKEWNTTEQGLQSPSDGEALTVKGDPMREYEFSVNIDTESLPEQGKAGIVLEYINDQNYVVAYTDYAKNQFKIYQIKNGKETLLDVASTARETIYGNANFDKGLDQKEYVYDLRAPAEVSQVKPLWLYGKYFLPNWIDREFKLPDPNSPNLGIDNWNSESGQWDSLDFSYDWTGRGDYHIAKFDNSIVSEKLRMNVPSIINRPFSFAVREEISAQNFYKTVRTSGKLYMWVNNELIFEVDDPFKNRDTQVGLYTDNLEATFNSFTGFDISDRPFDRKVKNNN